MKKLIAHKIQKIQFFIKLIFKTVSQNQGLSQLDDRILEILVNIHVEDKLKWQLFNSFNLCKFIFYSTKNMYFVVLFA